MAEKKKVKEEEEEEEEAEDETTSSNGDKTTTKEVWGTLEELLLACAVNRHGTNSWDSIADELQKRMSRHSFSPNHCHQKYVDLKRRFHVTTTTAGDDDDDGGPLLRMVDELRKLRVEELKQAVQRHDVSIVSLQLKVKRLEEEERERSSLKEEEPDLRVEPDENTTRTGNKPDEPDRSSREKVITGDSAEDRSFNESNSTNHNNKKNTTTLTAPEKESKSKPEEKGEATSHEPDPVRYRSSNEPGKDGGSGSEKVGNMSRTSRPGESSVKQQQSSDVQSSASLSKKKRRRFRGGGGSSGDELEAEEVSPANKRISVKSQPLIRFLEILRSHKHGSVFQRRLPSQETEKYRNVIRQHMDLDTVQSRLDKGIYSECHSKFYRDLLLIFTNAALFYRKSTAEHIAARELRRVVIDEIAHRPGKPNKAQPIKPDGELQHLEPRLVKKPRSLTTMVVCRRRSSSSMQALSESIKSKNDPNQATSKNNNSNTNISKKDDDDDDDNNNNNSSSRIGVREEKGKVDHHEKKGDGSINSSNALVRKKEENNEKGGAGVGVAANGKKLTKERSSFGRGGLRLSNNNSNNNNNNNNNNSSSKKKITSSSSSKEVNNREKVVGKKPGSKKEESFKGEGSEFGETTSTKKKMVNSNGDETPKQEKGTAISTTLKKQGVANFLKRMKQNSPSSQEIKLLRDDDGSDEEEVAKEDEEKREKTSNGKRRNIANTKKNNRTREGEGVATRGGDRRGTGRPPKRKAALISNSVRGSSTPDSGKGGGRSIGVGRDSGDKSKKKPRR